MSGKTGTSDKAKTVVYTRFDPATIDALDAFSKSHPLKPNRARLIELAVDEFIDRQKKSGKRLG